MKRFNYKFVLVSSAWVASILVSFLLGFYLGRIEGYGAKLELRGEAPGWNHRYTETWKDRVTP